ncbi:hypothetical protein IP90_03036 [Luteimonas cucumeris]|uniref:Uncharacterized protein n=1 Tax=Luteimonas cucumeris TaxID=985012 RepID=A0A562KWC6_9GAMM|nr:hypothetical protein [Luteimonas cucumeris]TWH99728.1 hypothetical protein IP90_03036 [Luteimonas cucumeris]
MGSDGNDGAGGVGNSNSSANSAGNQNNAADSLGNAAESVADAIGQAVDAVADAVSSVLGSASETGLGDALGNLADMLGIDAKDLQGLVGAALMGAITGGLPGAVMGVVNALTGGSLTSAARDAVASNLPSAMQPLANLAIDRFASAIPGAVSSTSLQGVLGTLATGALTNGRVPGMSEIASVARSMHDLSHVASGVMDSVTRGDFASALDAASALEGGLNRSFEQAREIAGNVSATFARGHDVYPEGGHGAFGDTVERLAVATTQLMARR